MDSFVKRLKELRIERKLSKRQIALVLGITPQAYQEYESGKSIPRTQLLVELAKYFGVTVGYLLGVEKY